MASTFVPPKIVKIDGVLQQEGRPRETLKILSHMRPSNLPGKSLIVATVDFPPNAASIPHTHSGAAIVAFPVTGTHLNQMNCTEPFLSKPGEFFYEAPGCHHQRSENASETEEGKLMVVIVVDDEVIKDGYENLVIYDCEREEKGLPPL